jgi:hypothetical protein
MQEPVVPAVALLLRGYVLARTGDSVDVAEFEDVLGPVLFPPRELWAAWLEGIVTRHEVCRAVAARIHTRLVRLGVATYHEDWEPLVQVVDGALFDR